MIFTLLLADKISATSPPPRELGPLSKITENFCHYPPLPANLVRLSRSRNIYATIPPPLSLVGFRRSRKIYRVPPPKQKSWLRLALHYRTSALHLPYTCHTPFRHRQTEIFRDVPRPNLADRYSHLKKTKKIDPPHPRGV